MDSLRYFVVDCHVDGFRFDLASALAREFYEVDRLSAFFDIIHQDPVLSQVKLIAEPWDVGPGGYQVGNFPVLWTEWNGLYRDTMRDFWRGQENVARLRHALHRLGRPLRAGRAPPVRVDQLRHRARRVHARRPRLVQREAQRGEPRGQPRRDRRQPLLEPRRRGADRRSRRSTRCGERQQRNFLTTLLLSQGVPMLLGGDELGRTQHGNNNAWCQDNELSWFDWDWDDDQRALARVHAPADRAAAGAPGLPAPAFLEGRGSPGADLPDVWWIRPDGRRMTQRDWRRGDARAIGVFLNGEEIRTRTPQGEPVVDAQFLLLFNAHHEPIEFKLPTRRFGARWQLELSTAEPEVPDGRARTRRARPCRSSRARCSCSAAAGEAHLDVPAAAAAGLRVRRGARARAVPARARDLPPLPLADHAGAAGLDARLRRRRPDAGLRAARRRGGVPRARRRRARRRARRRPEPHGRERREPVLGRPCAAREGLRLGPATGWYRRFFTIDELAGVRVEDPEVFELTHRKTLELVARRARRRVAHRPPGRARRPARLPRAAARRASTTSGSRRSSSRASGCATGRSRGRRATSSRTT